MDFEKLKRDAQNQLDRKLAEVERLTAVAKDLEKKNEEAQAEHEKLVDSLTGDINTLEAEKAFVADEIGNARAALKKVDDERHIAQKGIDQINAEYDDITGLIDEKNRELESIEKNIVEKTKEATKKTEKAARELASAEANIKSVIDDSYKEVAKIEKEIKGVEKVLAEKEEAVEDKKNELTAINEETKASVKAAEEAEYRAGIAKEQEQKSLKKFTEIVNDIKVKQGELAGITEEVESTKAALQPLLTKRINSENYMKELEYKEANLRKKYEAVGLTYEE